MTRILLLAAASAASLFASSASAQIINLASVDPVTGGAPASVTLNLSPGVYTATVIGTASGGAYNAWNKASSNGLFFPGLSAPAPGFYSEQFSATINGISTSVGSSSIYATAAAALAAATPFTFTVGTGPGSASESFAITDTFYSDNSGGVSLLITAAPAPEPATWAMMILGFGIIGSAMRRRSTVTTKISYAV